jgi:hypothetical protein
MLACSLPRMIRPGAGITEAGEAVIAADQLLDLRACAGLGQAKSYLANDFVTLITPCPGVAAHREEAHQNQRDPRYSPENHCDVILGPSLGG